MLRVCPASDQGASVVAKIVRIHHTTQPTVEQIAKTSTDALTESGHSSSAAFQDLSKANQEMAVRNANNLTVAVKELAGAQSLGSSS